MQEGVLPRCMLLLLSPIFACDARVAGRALCPALPLDGRVTTMCDMQQPDSLKMLCTFAADSYGYSLLLPLLLLSLLWMLACALLLRCRCQPCARDVGLLWP
jgi:hypothetical protein